MLNEERKLSSIFKSCLWTTIGALFLFALGYLATMMLTLDFPGRPSFLYNSVFVYIVKNIFQLTMITASESLLLFFGIVIAVTAELFLVLIWGKFFRSFFKKNIDGKHKKAIYSFVNIIYYLLGATIILMTISFSNHISVLNNAPIFIGFQADFKNYIMIVAPFLAVTLGLLIIYKLVHGLVKLSCRSFNPKNLTTSMGGTAVSKNRLLSVLNLIIAVFMGTSAYFAATAMDLNTGMRLPFMKTPEFLVFQKSWGFNPVKDITSSTWTLYGIIFAVLAVFILLMVLTKFFKVNAVSRASRKNKDVIVAGLKFDKRYSFVVSILGIVLLLGAVIGYLVLYAMNPTEHAFNISHLGSAMAASGVVLLVEALILIVASIIFKLLYRSLKEIQATAACESIDEGINRISDLLDLGIKTDNESDNTADNLLATDADIEIPEEDTIEENIEEVAIDTYFPSLIDIDRKYETGTANNVPRAVTDIKLDELVLRFHSYLINVHKIYFEIPVVRSYIAALGCARLIILEGLSGTGKTTLSRLFCYFISTANNVCPVQSTWRDRTDVIGYYNDFAEVYRETKILKALYEASYTPETPQFIIIDEMNLSRVEYYFADFLSVLEYPENEWKIELMPHINCKDIPKHIVNGHVPINHNTWIVGTGNKDDSTFAITDKVYDRAFVIDFDSRNKVLTSDYNYEPLPISTEYLYELYDQAKANPEYCLNDKDMENFDIICDLTASELEIVFGNRIMTQIHKFVPLFVAAGGTKEQAIDIIYARKVLRKLEGKFDDFIRDGLYKLHNAIIKTYGKGTMKEIEKAINKLKKKLV